MKEYTADRLLFDSAYSIYATHHIRSSVESVLKVMYWKLSVSNFNTIAIRNTNAIETTPTAVGGQSHILIQNT